MTMTERLLEQRSAGSIKLHMGPRGPRVLRESGAAKVRLPHGGSEAILINTSGGLAGGDRLHVDIACAAGTRLCVTSQAAERVYRTLGPPAVAHYNLAVGAGATLLWIPQETIVFDRAALARSYTVELAEEATFLAVEPLVFGRRAMGERVALLDLKDRWRVRRAGHLIHADDFAIDGVLPASPATLGTAGALATLIYVGADAEPARDRLRAVLGAGDGASAWTGKLVARLVAGDGFDLRKRLVAALSAILGQDALPRVWAV